MAENTSNRYAIECVDLCKAYTANLEKREQNALTKLNLKIKSGEVHGFLGHNGAGKTTAIKIIMGLIFPTSGEVKVFGTPTSNSSYLKKVMYIPELVNYYPFLTPVEILNYSTKLNPISYSGRNITSESINSVLKTVELIDWGNTSVEKFSKGMKQRLSLALCLLRQPDLLILDEPASGLDPEGISLLLEIIKQFKAAGKTVFFSSHHISEIEKVCDSVSIIKYGVLQESREIKEYQTIGLENRYLELMKK
ncbi:MAG: ABC transporter ATP-binding protein [Candidatus Wallbacteria bacterium]